MKRILLFSLILISASAIAQNTWTYIGDIDNGYGFWDGQTYAYKEGAQLLFTTDGGQTATASNFSAGITEPVVHCHYLDPNTIYMVQQDFADLYFHKSTDGGLNFEALGYISLLDGFDFNSLFDLHFFDENTGVMYLRTYADGEVIDVLIKTQDGGMTWDWAAPTTISDEAKDVVFTQDGTIFIFADGPDTIHTSTDLGVTWTEIGENPLGVSAEFAVHGNNIWGVGNGGAQQPCNVVSTDGGVTFTEWNIPDFANGGFDDCGYQIASSGSNSLVVSGHENGFQNEVTLYSTDGGETFSVIEFPDDDDHSLEFVYLADDGETYLYRSWTDTYVFGPGSGTINISESTTESHVAVYPNPSASGIIYFSEAQQRVMIFDYLGKFVCEINGGASQLDLSDLSPGVYILQLENQTERIILH